jgi:hypothetical protein
MSVLSKLAIYFFFKEFQILSSCQINKIIEARVRKMNFQLINMRMIPNGIPKRVVRKNPSFVFLLKKIEFVMLNVKNHGF